MTPSLRDLATDLFGDRASIPSSAAELAQKSVVRAHMAQHDGHGADTWGPWLRLACQAYLQSEQVWFAASFAAITGNADEVKATLWVPERPSRVDQQALGALLGWFAFEREPPSDQRLKDVADGYDELLDVDYYAMAMRGILQSNWSASGAAFNALAAGMSNLSHDWNAEHRPGYEPASTAVVALALQRGMPSDLLDEHARAAFWPAVGLSAGPSVGE